MDSSYALFIIEELEEEWYKPPSGYYHRNSYGFLHQSYKRSAIEEIKIYLKSHPDEDPIAILREFVYMLGDFTHKDNVEDANFIFSVYRDVAIDVLGLLSDIARCNEGTLKIICKTHKDSIKNKRRT